MTKEELDKIIKELGIDMDNIDSVGGAIDSIAEIIKSRAAGKELGPKEDQDVELDPDLTQPSNKNDDDEDLSDDYDIEDPDDVLKDMKQNNQKSSNSSTDTDADDDTDSDDTDDSDEDWLDSNDSEPDENNDEDSDNDQDEAQNDDDKSDADSDEDTPSRNKSQQNKSNSNDLDDEDDSDDEEDDYEADDDDSEDESDLDAEDNFDDKNVDTDDESNSDDDSAEDDTEKSSRKSKSTSDIDDDDDDFDDENDEDVEDFEDEEDVDNEDEFEDEDDEETLDSEDDTETDDWGPQERNKLPEDEEDEDDMSEDDDYESGDEEIEDPDDVDSDEMKNMLDNDHPRETDPSNTINKDMAKDILKSRVLNQANLAEKRAEEAGVDQNKIDDLKNAIKELADIDTKTATDDELNNAIDKVLNKINDLAIKNGFKEIDPEARKSSIQKVNNLTNDQDFLNELNDEDIEAIEKEQQDIAANKKAVAAARAARRNAGTNGFPGFKAFLDDMLRTIKSQITYHDVKVPTWSRPDKRSNASDNIVKKGTINRSVKDKKIPVIDFYFDRSGSWDDGDLHRGDEALAELAHWEKEGKLKINIWYFDSADSYPRITKSIYGHGRGTVCWEAIIDKIKATDAKNVVIMTDHDMETQGWLSPRKTMVDGKVWFLWKNGENAPSLPSKLRGKLGTAEFSFIS